MIYTLTAYLDPDYVRELTSAFHQFETTNSNELIRRWADLLVDDFHNGPQGPYYNIFIHINGIPMYSHIEGDDWEHTPDDPAITAMKTPELEEHMAQLFNDVENEMRTNVNRIRHENWHKAKEHEPVPGPGRRG